MMTPAQRALAADPAHIRIALAIARQHGRRVPHLADEFEAEAYLSVCVAAQDWPDEAPGGFASYLRACVHHRLSRLRYDWGPRGYRNRPQAIAIRALGRRAWLIVEDVPAVGWEVDYHDLLARLSGLLMPSRAELVLTYYGRADGMPLGCTARRFGISEMAAKHLHFRAVRDLRRQLVGVGVGVGEAERCA